MAYTSPLDIRTVLHFERVATSVLSLGVSRKCLNLSKKVAIELFEGWGNLRFLKMIRKAAECNKTGIEAAGMFIWTDLRPSLLVIVVHPAMRDATQVSTIECNCVK